MPINRRRAVSSIFVEGMSIKMNADDDFNVYAAPETILAPESSSIAEKDDIAWKIRRRHLIREIAVKVLACLIYAYSLMMMSGLIITVALLIVTQVNPRFIKLKDIFGDRAVKLDVIVSVALPVGMFLAGVLLFAVARGVFRLKPWSRWASGSIVILLAAGMQIRNVVLLESDEQRLIGSGIASIILLGIALLFIGPGGAYLFSDDYRAIVKSTPGARPWKTRRTATKRVTPAFFPSIFRRGSRTK